LGAPGFFGTSRFVKKAFDFIRSYDFNAVLIARILMGPFPMAFVLADLGSER